MRMPGVSLYKIDLWRPSFGDHWPLYPFGLDETIRDAAVAHSATDRSFMSVSLMLDGELLYDCDDCSNCLVRAGELFVIPINSSRSFRTTASAHYHKIALAVRGTLLPETCKALCLDRPLHLRTPSYKAMASKMRAIGALLKTGDKLKVPRAIALTHEFFSEISLVAAMPLERDMRMIAKARQRLENDLSQPLNIGMIASELGICHSMLDKLFRRKLGVSPLRYRNLRKMEEAKRLLVHSSLSIKEISSRLGYVSQLYFSNDFKARCGISPRSFRNSQPPETS